MAQATLLVTLDNERDVEAVNTWFRRWGTRIRCTESQGCGCCVDIWHVEAPAEALQELPPGMLTPATPLPHGP